MQIRPRRLFGLLFVGMWIVSGGCGGSSPEPGDEGFEGQVSGTVTLKGKPLASGGVLFEPTGGPAADTAPRTTSISAGSYNMILIPGQYRVTVQKSQGDKDPKPLGEPKQLEVGTGPKQFDIAL